MTSFGSLLKLLRLSIGISQRQLAASIGLNPSHLSRVERGQKNPPKRETIGKICKVLGLSQEQRQQLYEAAGYLAPQTKSKETSEVPGFHSPLRPSRKTGQPPSHEPQLQGLAHKAVEQLTLLLSRDDLSSRQRGRLAREVINFTEFLKTKIPTEDSEAEEK